MSAFSDYMENAILNWLLQNTAFPANSVTYLSLYTTAPTDTGGGTEVSGSNYSRVASTGLFPVASGASGSVTNSSDIVFPAATGSWGTIAAVGLMSASSGGNLLMWANLTTPQNILSGSVAKFLTGTLTFTVA